MSGIFNSIASIVRAYILPPSLSSEQIEQASKLAQVRRAATGLSDLVQATIDENRIAIFSKCALGSSAFADGSAHCPYCTRAKSLLQRELGQECKVRATLRDIALTPRFSSSISDRTATPTKLRSPRCRSAIVSLCLR